MRLRRDSRQLLLAAIVLAVAVQFALANVRAIEADEGFFAACALRQIALHAWPLTACVDTKPPGVFLLYEAAFRLFGPWQGFGLRLFWIAFALAATFATRGLGRQLADEPTGNLAAVILLLLLLTNPFFLALKTELPATALVLTALLIAPRTQSVGSALGGGMLVGSATLFKQPMLLFLIAPIAVLLRSQRPIRLCVALVIGCLIPLIFTAILYWGHGHLPGLVEQAWTRPRLYALHKTTSFRHFDALRRATIQLAPTLAIILLLGLGLVTRRATSKGGMSVPLIAYTGSGAALFALGGHYFPSYAVPLLPIVALFAARRIGNENPLAMLAALSAIGLAGWNVVTLRHDNSLARAIAGKFEPDERVYIWGYVPELYPELGRLPASRFIASSMLFGYFHDSDAYAPPLAGMRYVLPGDWARFLGELRAGPTLVIDTSAVRMGAYRNYPPDAFAPMRAYLSERCRPLDPVGAFPLYRCR